MIANAAEKYGIDPIIHFDATGSIMKNPLPNSKRIFLYSAVMHWRTGKEAFPLFDFLSNDQSQIFIASLLQLVKGFIVHHSGNRDFFRTFVVDFCRASLNAILDVTMCMCISEYLDRVYQSSVEGNISVKPKVTVLLCCSHYIKIITTDVRKIVRGKRLACFHISALVKILTGTSFIEVDAMVNSLLHIYLNPKRSKALQLHFEKLCNDVVEQEIDEEVKDEDKHMIDQEEAEAIYKASPFYKRYLGKAQDIAKQIIVTDDPVNEYCNDKLTELLLKKHLPYLPLWSSFMSPTGKQVC